MLDRLRSMEVFVAVANSGSFAAASAQLGMSAQMVARHVQALEERLNIRLIHRTTRRQSLTEFGRLYHERCTVLLAAIDATDALATELHDEPSGQLRISAPHQFGSLSLVRFVSDFMTRYPKVEVDLNLGDRVVHIIEEGFEAVFRIGDPGIGESSSLVVRPLRRYQMVACASAAYLEANGVPEHPFDLREHQCLSYVFWDRVAYDAWTFTKNGEEYRVPINGRLKVNDATAQLNAALNGMGILLAAEDLVADSLANGRLIQVLPGFEAPSKAMNLIYPADRQRSIKLRRFLDEAVEAFGGHRAD
ncbi:LysR family transcriptional regulator [Pseudomonas auratipiscis]|uniref:LysR family transcriptional regulator n=1 Tax=Pseudomonas auratipiscis TaxID=3115853 RepID=A0AB35WTE8_9PSED|nr:MULTISPECIES: LysR family transcriptional regulator [unclassified Pseudomonas]MEE1865384.1 LysR family transcriptional regulator [Pseudomonas sp. 120P]MEE1956630.1 LysR family transcriptional regulator [Pseudomonas sp. 119P]